MKVTFMGATGTVTGSRFLVEHAGSRILVDCGLFQGLKALRLRNWEPFPVDPASIDTVVLTHAHVDHSGYLPRFARLGFGGRILATPATIDLCGLLLPDAAHLQEEEARFRNAHGYTKHHPALPLYTREDADRALALMHPLEYGRKFRIGKNGLTVELLPAGHILGSAFVRFSETGGASRSLVFTGDIGRPGQPILSDPVRVDSADFLVMESTYGERRHSGPPAETGKAALSEIINETASRGGTILIPSFAVGRAQELIYILRELEQEGAIPALPVFVDSPMAINAFDVLAEHPEEHDREMRRILDSGGRELRTSDMRMTRTPEESKAINGLPGPMIIISASGMATGGRIVHHLAKRVGDARNAVVFPGFQAAGTRGRSLVEGAGKIKLFGIEYPVRASIHSVGAFSAHADYEEILAWLDGFRRPPTKTFLVHGEPSALLAMKGHIAERFNTWKVSIPEFLDEAEL